LHTDPLTGARYPDSTDSPDVSTYIQNAVNDLSDQIGGNFSTTSARDTAFSNWVAQGNSMTDGLQCRVAGYQQVYRVGAWHMNSSVIYSTPTMQTAVNTVSTVVASIAIPDPRAPYKIKASASVDLAQLGPGVHVRAIVRVNGTALVPSGLGAFNDTAGTLTDQLCYLAVPAVSGQLSGACTVDLLISKEAGAAGNGFQVSGSGVGPQFNTLWAEVIPV